MKAYLRLTTSPSYFPHRFVSFLNLKAYPQMDAKF